MRLHTILVTTLATLAFSAPTLPSEPSTPSSPAAPSSPASSPLVVKRQAECKYRTPCKPACEKESRAVDQCWSCIQSCMGGYLYYELLKEYVSGFARLVGNE
jgi:hypothetical protein